MSEDNAEPAIRIHLPSNRSTHLTWSDGEARVFQALARSEISRDWNGKVFIEIQGRIGEVVLDASTLIDIAAIVEARKRWLARRNVECIETLEDAKAYLHHGTLMSCAEALLAGAQAMRLAKGKPGVTFP